MDVCNMFAFADVGLAHQMAFCISASFRVSLDYTGLFLCVLMILAIGFFSPKPSPALLWHASLESGDVPKR